MFATYFAGVIVVAVIAFVLGRSRARALAGNQPASLHSRPTYHGGYAAILAAFPAFLILIAWDVVSPRIEDAIVGSRFTDTLAQLSPMEQHTFVRDARTLAGGSAFGEPTAEKQ